MQNDTKVVVLVNLLAEEGNELRSRAAAEHIYVAAVVGSFGAVVWGLSSYVPQQVELPWFQTPPLMVAVGVVFVTVAIVIRIVTEHLKYETIKLQRADVYDALVKILGSSEGLPSGLGRRKVGPGYLTA